MKCLLLPCAKSSSVQTIQVVEKEASGEDTTSKLQARFVHDSEQQFKKREHLQVDSALDVHLCSSGLCTACRPDAASVQFIKLNAVDLTPAKPVPAVPTHGHEKARPPRKRLVIENMSCIGTIGAYSTHDLELKPTESLSSSSSVDNFIASIEGETKEGGAEADAAPMISFEVTVEHSMLNVEDGKWTAVSTEKL